MAFDPLPFYFVLTQRSVQALPEIDIFNWFFVRRFPAALFPVVDPLSNTLTHILAVGTEDHFAMFFQRFEGDDGGHHLHAVIRREVKAFAKGFFFSAIA